MKISVIPWALANCYPYIIPALSAVFSDNVSLLAGLLKRITYIIQRDIVNLRTTTTALRLNTRCHDDVIKRKHFLSYWPFVGESTGHPWIPLTKDSDAELWCYLWSAPEQKVEQTTETLVTWDAIALIMTSLKWCKSCKMHYRVLGYVLLTDIKSCVGILA